ncbi:type 1 glutamine amidotransferase [Zoogloea oleivorans]|uniref:Type 1 glutamine amidotransferase n=1 Tax=Zoogloea oleivorans TaxID=1552750 RepID=A0A6C2CYS0_9RHOO|nr:type 1 glutamine amidotransferase [Zoogloea oleivorans]TYC58764.1 type 1 glutamine amidotransferase [Zoogloea oleivorans]
MKPVAIIRHSLTEGPGHFATFLERHSQPWELIRIDAGDPVPVRPDRFSGLALMGGPMSVNDDLPWIPPVLDLIRWMMASNRPVIGHCLGGQLMSKALGGVVTQNPVKEIGWLAVSVVDSPMAQQWFGDTTDFESFHWHGETFSIPEGATRLLASQACKNQAFALGKHLGMQCHVEMTAQMIREWCLSGAGEIEACGSLPTVQQAEQMETRLEARLGALNAAAERVYAQWIKGLVQD